MYPDIVVLLETLLDLITTENLLPKTMTMIDRIIIWQSILLQPGGVMEVITVALMVTMVMTPMEKESTGDNGEVMNILYILFVEMNFIHACCCIIYTCGKYQMIT